MTRTEHLLICLAEECAEIQYAVTKSLRFGLADRYVHSKDPCPKECISRELNDLIAVAEMLRAEGTLDDFNIERVKQDKVLKVLKFMDYSRDRGLLEEDNGKG
jgi:hypothetical protein